MYIVQVLMHVSESRGREIGENSRILPMKQDE
jgi:hypothetical protein